MKRFTDRSIQSLQPKEKPYLKSEASGLYVRVYPSGKKAWLAIFPLDGKRRWHKLGEYPHTNLSEARDEFQKVRKLLDRGEDPVEVKRQQKAARIHAPTVEDLIKEYLNGWAKKRKRTWKEDDRILNKDVKPAWSKLRVKDIRRRDVILLVEKIAGRAPIQANRTLAVVRKMFNWAVSHDIVEVNPCTQVKAPGVEKRKERVLSEKEIKTVWNALDGAPMSGEIRCALRLILITAQRPTEVIGMRAEEIDGRWWTIPAERAKNKLTHRVYLSDLAMEVLGEGHKGFVFESPRGKKAIHVNALAHAVRATLKAEDEEGNKILPVAHFTPHDLRRTAASHMTGSGTPRLVVSKILNHVESGVTAVYDRHSYDREKQQALAAWGRKLENVIAGKAEQKVVPLTR